MGRGVCWVIDDEGFPVWAWGVLGCGLVGDSGSVEKIL